MIIKNLRLEVMQALEQMPGITSGWNTTGRFDLFLEIMVDSLKEPNRILFGKDQRLDTIGEILSSEIFILLESNTKTSKLI